MTDQPDLDARVLHLRKMSAHSLKVLYEARKHIEAKQRDLAMLSLDETNMHPMIALNLAVGKLAPAEIREQSWALRCELAAIAAEERIWREIHEVTR